jgi:hypothetical protein
MAMSAPLCPSCGQPASESLAGGDAGWECRNEACPEFGQPLRAQEPAPADPPDPGDSAGAVP